MVGYCNGSVSAKDGKKAPWFIHASGPLLAAGVWEGTSLLLDPDTLGTSTVIRR